MDFDYQDLENRLQYVMQQYGTEGFCPLAAAVRHMNGCNIRVIGWRHAARVLSLPLPIVYGISEGFDGAEFCNYHDESDKQAFDLGQRLRKYEAQ